MSNFESIERPYGELLEREAENLVPDSTAAFAVGGGDSGSTVIGQSEGNTPEDVITNGEQIGDLYIRNFIRSQDWKPQTQGFYIDGETGYAEFSNVHISGDLGLGPGSIISGGQTDWDTGDGYWLGFYELDETYRFSIGSSVLGPKLTWDGTNLNVIGGDITTPGTGTDLSLLNYSHTVVFSVASANQLNWAAGIITFATGVQNSIVLGNTGAMAGKTYIYLDTDVSTTVLQTTTTAATASGPNKVLIAIASPGTSEVGFVVLNDQQAKWSGNDIEADSITANELSANSVTATEINVSQLSAISADMGSITAGTITGALIRTSSSGGRVEISDAADNIEVYDTGGTRRMELDTDELTFYNSSGSRIGYITTPASSSFFIGAPNGNYLNLEAEGSAYAIVFDIAGVTKGNFNSNGLNMSGHINMGGSYDITNIDDIVMDGSASLLNMNGGDISNVDRVSGSSGYFDYNASGDFRVNAEITPSSDNSIDLGSPNYLWQDIYGTDLYYTNLKLNSDRRLKNTIVAVEHGLDAIMQLNPVSFYYNEKSTVVQTNVREQDKPKYKILLDKERNNKKLQSEKLHYGFIAQDVMNVLPSLISNLEAGEGDKMANLAITEMIPVLTKAIQELNVKFEDYKNTN